MLNPIPYIIATITRQPREKIEPVWSSKSWVHNIFRVWELVAGRKVGIRAELTTVYTSEKGKPDRIYYVCHSFESVCALLEQKIREFKLPKLVKVYLPSFAPALGPSLGLRSPFMFAIAHDADATSITNGFAGTTTTTWNHTVTGTNPLLVSLFDIWQDVAGTGTITANTYNSVAASKVDGLATGAMRAELWYLKAPATGTNTQSATLTGNHDAKKYATSSYTGVDQTAPLDSHSTGTGSSGNPSASTTTVAANTVVVATLSRFSTTAASTSQTSIYNNATGSILGAASYQIVSSAGSKTDTYTGSSATDWSMCIASFAQASASVYTKGNFLGLL